MDSDPDDPTSEQVTWWGLQWEEVGQLPSEDFLSWSMRRQLAAPHITTWLLFPSTGFRMLRMLASGAVKDAEAAPDESQAAMKRAVGAWLLASAEKMLATNKASLAALMEKRLVSNPDGTT